MGGFYERLVGLTKRLRKAIGKKLLTYNQLITIIKVAESVVNARPLVYVSDDVNSTIVITTRHFSSPNPFTGIPEVQSDENDPTYSPVDSSSDKLLNMWKKGQNLLDYFWISWRHDYLTSLRQRTQTRIIQKQSFVSDGEIDKLFDIFKEVDIPSPVAVFYAA